MVCGTTITDPEGRILFFSKSFAEFVGLDPEAQIGKRCLDVIPTSRMHVVGRTGVPELNDLQVINGKERVVQRIPLKKNGKVVAVVSQVIFKERDEIVSLVRKLKLMKKKMKLYEGAVAAFHNTRYAMDSFVGASRETHEMKKKAARAARTNLPILIVGESGTGKEVLAQAIHNSSPRKHHPFIRINCANLPRELLEAELFGYEAGAFTGARSEGHMGKFELANNGTVFLDEIGEMPFEMQAKLLSVLEEKTFYRVGGNTLVHADFRIISATNRDLHRCMDEGRFRKDLFYRLNAVCIPIKPLRERREDIEPITHELLKRNLQEKEPSVRISTKAKQIMHSYNWPGNVRELANCIECALAFCEHNVIEPAHLSISGTPLYLPLSPSSPVSEGGDPEQKVLRNRKLKAEYETILGALEACRWCKTEAAQMLGIHRSLLYRKIAKLGLDKPGCVCSR